MLYLITSLHSGNARQRNVRFRKSHFSNGEILVLEGEEAESNGCFSKRRVGVVLMATKRRKTVAEFNIIGIDYINSPDERKNIWAAVCTGLELCASEKSHNADMTA